MKITDNSQSRDKEIMDLDAGDVFYYAGEYYILTDEYDEMEGITKAIMLRNGVMCGFEECDTVSIPVTAELIIS